MLAVCVSVDVCLCVFLFSPMIHSPIHATYPKVASKHVYHNWAPFPLLGCVTGSYSAVLQPEPVQETCLLMQLDCIGKVGPVSNNRRQKLKDCKITVPWRQVCAQVFEEIVVLGFLIGQQMACLEDDWNSCGHFTELLKHFPI